MNISVFGLGYVGAVSCGCFAKMGHQLIGVDVNALKVELMNKGLSPITEPGLDELIAQAKTAGLLFATTDSSAAIANTDISLVCVGTPSQANGSADLSYIYKVMEEIGQALRDKSSFHNILIRSTVPPGTIKTCTDIVARHSGKNAGEDFAVVSNPEFLREGTAIKDFFDPPYTVIGSDSDRAYELAAQLYETLEAPIFRVKPEESELIKYANNNFHALKITFANEIGNICKALNVDSHVVMNLVAQDTKLNLSPYYLKPGFAFGGSCLPKDVRGLNYVAKSLDVDIPVLSNLMRSNDYQIKRALDLIFETGIRKVAFLGFAFKANTDDLRESPIVTLIETLIGKGYEVKVYDSNVYLSKLMGKNKDFLSQHIPHIDSLFVSDLDTIVQESDLLIIGNGSAEFKTHLPHWIKDKKVIDLVRISKELVDHDNYVGICW
ncbi:MAG TPA: UDP-glucose/GDP-mannose dehydrogenase family protein [Saprospiraceae bacterium]|mgnify:CR=1 FL=1|nr:UDP-glucose/GDP-mannose dehydrogenase family protein [Saprospiraceae bacterium]HMQ81461.1 UDP-glucose/GDP-mannose dehydrogenase family protein [Saprospiraceae bacterium]